MISNANLLRDFRQRLKNLKFFHHVPHTALFMLGLTLGACQESEPLFLPQYTNIDLLIENAMVLDGLGGPASQADVVVVEDKIVYVGSTAFSTQSRAGRIHQIIDASGLTLSPGFIDLHSHGDPLDTPEFENFLAMGVTTISLGQDGSSPDIAPLSDWLSEVSIRGIGPNLVMFVGHGTLRDQSGIGRTNPPDAEDFANMLSILDSTLKYSFGLSTGLEYNPGLNADVDELMQLAHVIGQNDRMIMSHMRNEDDDQLEASIAELVAQGKEARVHIAHLKSVFGTGAERADEIIQLIINARSDGIELTADSYPYNASYTGISIVFPVWAKTQEQFDIAKRERREELAEYLRKRVHRRNGPQATLLGTGEFTGKTLADIAIELEMPFEDVLIDIIGPQGASGAYFVMNEQLQARILQSPIVGISSDGRIDGFHPRGHGTFAKIIEKYVVQQKMLSLSEAVRKMTSLPAQILHITDRGVIREGMFADIVLFDPAKVHATATYPNPLQLAQGFHTVIINGKIARTENRMSPELHGRVLQPRAEPSANKKLQP